MKIKLLIDGEDKRVSVVPEDESDRKLLEFIATHEVADVKTNRKYSFGETKLEDIELKFGYKAVVKEESSVGCADGC